MTRVMALACLVALGSAAAPGATSRAEPVTAQAHGPRRAGLVRVVDHGLVDAQGPFLGLATSAADIATWHFSRDRRTDDGWKPVYDCWELGQRRGFPPVSSNEPIGPGSSVATENSRIRLVKAAAFAYVARLPMYVFHSEAGVFGTSRFEDTPGIKDFRYLLEIQPGDLPNWRRNDGCDGCVRNIGAQAGDRFICVPLGIRENGLQLQAREDVRFEVFDPLTGKVLLTAEMKAGEQLRLPQGPGGLIIRGRIREQ